MTPIRSSADVTRLRAAALGLYASASIAAITAALVSGRIPWRPLIARDTVIGDTPTFAATSLIVAWRLRWPGLFNDALPSRQEELLEFFAIGTSRFSSGITLS